MVQASINKLAHFIQSLRNWCVAHKSEAFILALILFVAAFCRLYRIGDYLTFLGDEGRDVIIVRRFLTQGDIMLIGPGTSIGNMYLGPLYYYLMAPFLFIANYSPVGPAVGVALLGIFTVWFVWFVTRAWFGKTAAVVAALIYALSPTVIIYSRSSWNPNILPFFSLLAMWAIWKVWHEKQYRWIPVAAVSLAASLQSHYLALLLFMPVGIFWLLSVIEIVKNRKPYKQFLLWSVLAGVLFLILMSPLAIFDYRHNWMNFNAIKVFFTERQTTVSIKPWKALPGIFPQLSEITTRLVGGYEPEVGQWIALSVLASAFLLLNGARRFAFTKEKKAVLLLLVWLGTGLLGLALYKQQIYDHYYGFLFVIPFILIGAVLGYISHKYRFRGMWWTVAALMLLVWVNLKASPLQYQPNRQLPRSTEVADFILNQSGTETFNFAVIAERNYEGAYQYFLDGNPRFRVIDPQNTKDTIAPQLFVACELPVEKCDPTHNAKAEIANFGWSKIENTWNVSGVNIFKLVHDYPTPSSTPSATLKKSK